MENINHTKVDLITGFLGAGKTTFIIQYCNYLKSIGESFIIIENEFGLAGIDVSLLKQKDIPVTELSGGCICCSLKIDFVYALIDLAGKYDHIIVEPSGIFTVKDFFDVVLGSEISSSGLAKVGCIATVIDPSMLDNLSEDEEELFVSQCECAGCIVLSKNEPLNAFSDIKKIKDLMNRLNPSPPNNKWLLSERDDLFFSYNRDEFDSYTFEKISNAYPLILSSKKTVVNHALIYQSTTLNCVEAFELEELRQAIDLAFSDCASVVLRIKGFVRLVNGEMVSVNCTKDNYLIETCCDFTVLPLINVIGKKLKRQRLKELFKITKNEKK